MCSCSCCICFCFCCSCGSCSCLCSCSSSFSSALAEPRSEASPGRAGGFGAVGRTSGSCFCSGSYSVVRVCPFPPFRLLSSPLIPESLLPPKLGADPAKHKSFNKLQHHAFEGGQLGPDVGNWSACRLGLALRDSRVGVSRDLVSRLKVE